MSTYIYSISLISNSLRRNDTTSPLIELWTDEQWIPSVFTRLDLVKNSEIISAEQAEQQFPNSTITK